MPVSQRDRSEHENDDTGQSADTGPAPVDQSSRAHRVAVDVEHDDDTDQDVIEAMRRQLAQLEGRDQEYLQALAPERGKRESDRRALPPVINLGTIMTALHDSEINGEVSWFFDGVWSVKLGDVMNGYEAEAIVASTEEAAEWLCETAVRLYPESEFAKLYGRGFDPQ
jgi:hypothetical protein